MMMNQTKLTLVGVKTIALMAMMFVAASAATMDEVVHSAMDAWTKQLWEYGQGENDNEPMPFGFFQGKSRKMNNGKSFYWENLECAGKYYVAYRDGKTTKGYTEWVFTQTDRRRLLSSKSGHPVFRRLLRKLRNA